MKKVYIFVDDIRTPQKYPDNYDCLVVRSYKDAIVAIQDGIQTHSFIVLDLDHDLGEKKSGYDIAKWIVHNRYKNLQFLVHSMNPVGRNNIIELLTHYGYQQLHNF